jgi:oligoribonuclease (3'-5' exoribonuclease)
LRSFDRIALTQEIIDQQRKSGVDAVKADIALDLDLNGVDSIKTDSITVAAAPTGDNLDAVAHQKKKEKHVKEANLESLFAWGRKDDSRDKHQKLSNVLSGFEGAIKDSKVSESVAEHGMMTGQNVYDQTWQGKDQDAVKNFVSEELYIHSKVFYF